MLKAVLTVLVAIIIAVGGGAASVAYMLDDSIGAGTVTFGPWTAVRSIGSRDADPYSRARISREGILALGEGEGLAFVAESDSNGQRLRYDCVYRVEGAFPSARFWTLFVEPMLSAASSRSDIPAIQSRTILRRPDNSVVLTVGRQPAPGNWLHVKGDGNMRFVATLYDFSLATQTVAPDNLMPTITQVRCDV